MRSPTPITTPAEHTLRIRRDSFPVQRVFCFKTAAVGGRIYRYDERTTTLQSVAAATYTTANGAGRKRLMAGIQSNGTRSAGTLKNSIETGSPDARNYA